jgi:hypothetical protein
MHIIILLQKVGWLGGKTIDYHLWGQGSIFTNDMGCGQWWLVDQIFLTYIAY